MIREKDGIHFDHDKLLVADSRKARGDVNFISHAHMDHGFQDSGRAVCSEQTASILSERTGSTVESIDNTDIELFPSGHIIGSRAARFGKGEKILYTGDVSLQDRTYMKGFQPVDADVLVVESTYGVPAYRLPEQKEVEKQIRDWVQDTDQNIFLFGYSMGKAQKIQKIVEGAADRPIVAHGAIRKMNDAVEKVTDLEFRAEPYTENKDLIDEGAIFIGPTRTSRADWLQKKVDKLDGVKAGFSGWGIQDSYTHRGGYDKTFPLSDHCGFDDLVRLVEKVDPDKVYTHHGFDEAFAGYLRREKGYNARALKQNQASLTDF